jgi:ABC-2 type transport system ATP-binding protein
VVTNTGEVPTLPLALQTIQLSHRFGPVLALDRLDLGVPVGSIYGFLGSNGAGKTTTIRALLGLIRPRAGEVRLLGQPLVNRQRAALLRRVGSLVETPSLYPHLTGAENLAVKQQLVGLPRTEIDRVLAVVGLRQDAGRLVRGYSLGMQQRLGLAKALMGAPDLLILDEPTNGLDPAGIHELRELIRRLPGEHGVTVFLSSHLLGEVEHMATHVGIIGRGRVLFEGTLGELHGRTGERLLLEVDRPATALQLLARAGWQGAERVGEAGRIEVHIGGRDEAARINGLLVQAGVAVTELRVEQPSLEALFLQLTGGSQLDRQVAA